MTIYPDPGVRPGFPFVEIDTVTGTQTLGRKWITALRSNQYTQGFGALKQKGAFCVAGVLCDVSGIGKWEDLNTLPSMYTFPLSQGSDKRTWIAVPPSQITALFPDGVVAKATKMNDEGKTFAEIADYLELNLN